MRYYCLLYLLLFILCSFVDAAELRTWTGSNGKAIEAEFISFDEKTEIVHIRLKNGKDQRVKLSLFSRKDKDFVEGIGKTDNPFGKTTNLSSEFHIHFHLDKFGEGFIQLEKGKSSRQTKFQGMPFDISSIQHAKVRKSKGDIINLVHDFSNPDPFDSWGYQMYSKGFKNGNHGIKLDPQKSILEMNPVPFVFSNEENVKTSFFDHRGYFNLPLTLRINVLSCDSLPICIGIQNIPGNKSHFKRYVCIKRYIEKNTFQVQMFWAKDKEVSKEIFNRNNISLETEWKHSFKIPGPSQKITEKFSFSLAYGYVENNIDDVLPLQLSQLDIAARFLPMIGVGFTQKGSTVYLQSVHPDRPAAHAGLQEGDVIKEINGKSVNSPYEASEKIHET